MRAEKQSLTEEYKARLNRSPFFIVADYQGLKVGPITELRKRLAGVGAEMHVVKNSIFALAAKEAGLEGVADLVKGQLAVVTGQEDVSAAAKVLKTFAAEFEKPTMRFGYLNNEPLNAEQLQQLADLPSLDVLRSQLMALINTPATQLARVIQTPGEQLARVLQARVDKANEGAGES